MIKLNVPYRSQWDANATEHETDCGPACLSMVLAAYGREIATDRIYDFIGERHPLQFIKTSELRSAGDQLGLPTWFGLYPTPERAIIFLKDFVRRGHPFITLVKYDSWRPYTGNQFTGGHFVVVVGFDNDHIIFHDPLFGHWRHRDDGLFFYMQTELFADAWGGFVDEDDNPNYTGILPQQSLRDLTPLPVIVDPSPPPPADAPPTPVPPPPAAPPSDSDIPLALRMQALAAYVHNPVPDLSHVEEWTFYNDRIGDWGATYANHTVIPGDTLAGIAIRFYGDWRRWRALVAYNQLPNEWLIVGQTIKVPLFGNSNAHLDPSLPMSGPQDATDDPFAQFTPTRLSVSYDSLAPQSAGVGDVNSADSAALQLGIGDGTEN